MAAEPPDAIASKRVTPSTDHRVFLDNDFIIADAQTPRAPLRAQPAGPVVSGRTGLARVTRSGRRP
jgi:hypothetical protein